MIWKYMKYYIKQLCNQYDSLKKTLSLHLYPVLEVNVCYT